MIVQYHSYFHEFNRVYDAPVLMHAPMIREFARQQKKLGVSNMDKFRVPDVHAFLMPVILSLNVRLILGEELASDGVFIDDLSDWSKAAVNVTLRPSFLGIFARRRCLQASLYQPNGNESLAD